MIVVDVADVVVAVMIVGKPRQVPGKTSHKDLWKISYSMNFSVNFVTI